MPKLPATSTDVSLSHPMRTNGEHDGTSTRSREEPAAFDLWIKRVLKERYGRIVREPVPDDLLQLLSSQPPPH
jgi:hypothetical protein